MGKEDLVTILCNHPSGLYGDDIPTVKGNVGIITNIVEKYSEYEVKDIYGNVYYYASDELRLANGIEIANALREILQR